MEQILEAAATLPVSVLGPRAVLVSEGARTGKLYILKSGDLEVVRDGTSVAAIGEPGSVVGDMSVLLDLPHSATVRTRHGAEVYVADDADAFLDATRPPRGISPDSLPAGFTRQLRCLSICASAPRCARIRTCSTRSSPCSNRGYA